MDRRRAGRGHTMVELMVVMAIAGVFTSLGVSSMVDVISDARYRADRARVFLTVAEARDIARDRRRGVEVEVTVSGVVGYKVRADASCTPASPLGPPYTVEVSVPSVRATQPYAQCITPTFMPA